MRRLRYANITATLEVSMSLYIRKAESHDLTQILNWTLKLHFHEDDGSLLPHESFEENLAQWLEKDIKNSSSLYLIGIINDQPVAFIAGSQVINDNGFLKSPTKGIIQLLWVEPDYRAHGIAQKLLATIEECFSEIGIGYIECTYTANNSEAKAFWQKHKFMPFSVSMRKFL